MAVLSIVELLGNVQTVAECTSSVGHHISSRSDNCAGVVGLKTNLQGPSLESDVFVCAFAGQPLIVLI